MTRHVTSKTGSTNRPPLLLGHRGARANELFQENTPASFDRALADGCDGFEFDLRLTSDGVAVVCHDPSIQLNGKRVTVARTRARALSALSRLEDVIERYAGKAFLDVELKVVGLEGFAVKLLGNLTSGEIVVSSFLPRALQDLHSLNRNIPLGLICETTRRLQQWPKLPVSHVILQQELAAREIIEEIQAAGKKIFVWTVNTAATMKRFSAWGVDGIISDKTELLARTLRAADRPNT